VDIWDDTTLVLFLPRPVLSILQHEGESIQDFHPLILKHVKLHCDGVTDGSDKLFGFISTPVKISGSALWLSLTNGSQSHLAY